MPNPVNEDSPSELVPRHETRTARDPTGLSGPVNMLTTVVLSLTSRVKTIIWPYAYISHEPRSIVRGRPVPSFVRCAWRRSIGRRPGLPDRLRQEANRPREGQRRTRLHPPERRHLDRTVRPGHAITRRRRTRGPPAVFGRPGDHRSRGNPGNECRGVPTSTCVSCSTTKNGKG